jgi:hypothetical protein
MPFPFETLISLILLLLLLLLRERERDYCKERVALRVLICLRARDTSKEADLLNTFSQIIKTNFSKCKEYELFFFFFFFEKFILVSFMNQKQSSYNIGHVLKYP